MIIGNKDAAFLGKLHLYCMEGMAGNGVKLIYTYRFEKQYRSDIRRRFAMWLREIENNFTHLVNFMAAVKFFSLFQMQSAHIQRRLETRRRNTVPACSTILTTNGHESPPF